MVGNNTTETVDVDNSIDGQFTYYIPTDFSIVNNQAEVFITLSFPNANFPDDIQNIKQKIYDCIFEK
jgi:hypothetical protein